MKEHRVSRKSYSLIPLLVACAVVVAACGQKSGVHVAASGSGGSGGGQENGSADIAGDTSGAAGPDAGVTSGGETAGGSATAGGTTGAAGAKGGTTGAAGSAAGGGATAGGTAAGPGDRTGVTADTITIGIHAPASGAGAPALSFNKYKDAYFKFIGNTINGRGVKVAFEDDGYNPSQAVAACKKLVQEQHVFLLVGGGGTDQIVACANYANGAGVPYLAEGVTEAGVSTLKTYFAESMTYKAQSTLLAQYIKNKTGRTKWAMIRGDTANFADAHTAFVNAAGQQGLTKFFDDAVDKNSDNQAMDTEAKKFCATTDTVADHSDVALFPLMSPKLFIAFASSAAGQQCFPRYAGIGITLGLNVVAKASCTAFKSGATFFSPYQGLDKAEQDFKTNVTGEDVDDIAYGLWAAEKLLAAQLKAGGKDLTRQSFIQGVLSQKTFAVGTYPPVNYNNTRFGGTATHVLKADCTNASNGHYVTDSENNTGF